VQNYICFSSDFLVSTFRRKCSKNGYWAVYVKKKYFW